MKKWKTLALCAACLASLTLAAPDFADAARLGKGRSFGSSSIMSRPATPPSGAFQGGSSSVNRQAPLASSRANGGAATMANNKTGLFGGLFGGLLAGTMLGSLLGGTGMGGGMVGGLMNLLLLGLLVYFGVRLFRRFRGGQESSREEREVPRSMNYQDTSAGSQPYGQAGGAWDSLRSAPQAPAQEAAQPAADGTRLVVLRSELEKR